jgi:hypothetical protein
MAKLLKYTVRDCVRALKINANDVPKIIQNEKLKKKKK